MNGSLLSRRNWFGRMMVAAMGARPSTSWVTNARPLPSLGSTGAEGPAEGRIYNVREYGAKGDGKTLDTNAVQAAIDACNRDKGGIVMVPAGTFLIGSIELKSHVTLHLSSSACLLGIAEASRYKKVVDRVPYLTDTLAMISATDAEDIAIEGKGMIDGQGAAFLGKGDEERPMLLVLVRCKNFWLRDITLKNSAFWCTHLNGSSDIMIDGLVIHSRANTNNDGLHFDNCRHIRVSNCNIACSDDACGLFGGNQDVTITNSAFSTRWSVFRFGGGPGYSKDIAISNCVIYDTFGCPIKMQVAQGTRLEDIRFSNLVMSNVTGPIYIGVGSQPANAHAGGDYWPTRLGEATPGGTVRNIAFDGIRATVAPAPDLHEYPWEKGAVPPPVQEWNEQRTCINLTAVDGQFVENVSFNDVHVTFPGGGTTEEAALRQVTQMSGDDYSAMGVLPAYGMYARNVRGLSINNMRLDLAAPDLRPALVFDNVEDAGLNAVSAEGNVQAESLLRFTGTHDALLTACRVLKSCGVFLQVEGTRNGLITLAASDLSKAKSPLAFTRGATEEAVKLRP